MHIPNQPLNQHPQGFYAAVNLGRGALLFPKDQVQRDEDILIIPPPPKGVVRRCAAIPLTHAQFLNRNGDDLTSATFIYRTSAGDILFPQGVIPDGSLIQLVALPGNLFLTENDLGIFLRITNDVPLTDVSGFSHWEDVRNVQRQDVSLEDTSLTEVLSSPKDGNTRAAVYEWIQPAPIYLFNFDTVLHNVELYMSDGTSDVLLGTFVAPANTTGSSVGGNPVVLQPGWSLKAKLLEAVVTTAPVFSTAYSDLNLSPVRQDQGGAY